MKFGFKAAIGLIIGAVAIPAAVSADDQAPATQSLSNKADRVSYSLGVYIANNFIKRNGAEVDVDVMAQAIKDVLGGRELKLNDQQAMEVLRSYEQELRAKREEQRNKLAQKNRSEGDQFLLANKQKPGIQTRAVKLSENSLAELQYKVITEGTGESPKAGDTVVVNMKGSLTNGKEFENLTSHRIPVGRLALGLNDAVLTMKPGSKYQVFLPSTLAYGDFGHGPNVEPGAAVIYDLELVSMETPQPLTSDIVMVPSVEQMKAGSNIVVIKPADAAKYAQTNAAPQKAPAPPKK